MTPSLIFDQAAREFHGPAPRIMPGFDYLNSSSRPEAERVRSLLDEWCSLYPPQARSELIARLRTRNDVGHKNAVFELTVHELLRRRVALQSPFIRRFRVLEVAQTSWSILQEVHRITLR
jgi:hypothetical protein